MPRAMTITASALCYALAFNLTFFGQELFLVLSKTLVPGLHPVLFHNNHDWSGKDPIAELLQGTGALATVVMSLVVLAVPVRTPTLRLFRFWLGYCGLFMALPQVVMAAFIPMNDVGRALRYLGFGPAKLDMAAVIAVIAMIRAADVLAKRFLPTGGAFWIATLPALIGTVLVLPFRVPGNPIEVALVPLIVFAAGVPLIQLFSGRATAPPLVAVRVALPAALLVVLLAVFQLGLSRGIAFY